MKINFDQLIEGPDGDKRPGDPISNWIVQIFSTYDSYEGNDSVAMWGILQEIERHGHLEGDKEDIEKDIELLRKYLNKIDMRLDLEMTIRDILDVEE